MSLQPGKIIQNYRLVRFLGDGGMGSVWLAEHVLLERKVAIKCLHQQFARNEGIRARFKQEAATLARLQHAGIVALHDYIEDEEGSYLVMEYVEGRPLDEYIQNVSGPIPDGQLREMFGHILEGFVYAHGKMIVHRDIKPSNFLVTPTGKVKILDFGIAKILTENDRKLTKTGMNMGTVYYMSPEQVKGEVVDVRSDIYSLGVTLFQMATGRCPYPDDTTEFYVYDQIVNHPLPPAREFYPGVTAAMEAIIAKATAKKLEDRFQDCSAFLAAVRGEVLVELNETEADSEEGGDAGVKEEVSAPLAPLSSLEQPSAAPVLEREAESRPGEVAAVEASGGVGDTSEVPAAPRRRKRRGWIWILLLLIVGGGTAVTLYSLDMFPTIAPKDDSLYVIASNLFLRSSPSMEESAKTKSMIPYGSKVKVKSRPKSGWVEIDRSSGKPVFVAESYLVDHSTFLELDHLCLDEDARKLLRESSDKVAIRDYFDKNGFHADLSPAEYKEVYGEERDPSKIWYVRGESEHSYFHSVLASVKLEKGEWENGEKENMAVVLVNKGDPEKRRMVAFHFDKKGEGYQGESIGVVDLSDCGGCLMRQVTYEDVRGTVFNSDDDRMKVFLALSEGKEGILLQSKVGEPLWKRLVVWESRERMVIYTLY